ncbi:hypothetical protein NDU88_001932 [Pleurodeles waltl]|uniref:Uncharacterized protein n=1 Tax=Pleurodeles waltl TaxID=8319 RepID=A0AAV7U7T7_PLEWA|nr:hypothetical protein NDU88_001932 [Pleurodeles waltl]
MWVYLHPREVRPMRFTFSAPEILTFSPIVQTTNSDRCPASSSSSEGPPHGSPVRPLCCLRPRSAPSSTRLQGIFEPDWTEGDGREKSRLLLRLSLQGSVITPSQLPPESSGVFLLKQHRSGGGGELSIRAAHLSWHLLHPRRGQVSPRPARSVSVHLGDTLRCLTTCSVPTGRLGAPRPLPPPGATPSLRPTPAQPIAVSPAVQRGPDICRGAASAADRRQPHRGSF